MLGLWAPYASRGSRWNRGRGLVGERRTVVGGSEAGSSTVPAVDSHFQAEVRRLGSEGAGMLLIRAFEILLTM